MAEPRKSYGLWITGRILRALFVLLILAVCALLVWRVFISARIPADMRTLDINDDMIAAYRSGGNTLHPLVQKQTTVTRGENNYGYFGIPRCVFYPEAGQVQVVFRYNNATLAHAKEDFALAEEPARGEEVFDVSMVLMIDLTPEDKSDNTDDSETIQKLRIAPAARRVRTTALYTYFLYTFYENPVRDDVIAAFFDIYYKDAADYSTEPYGTLRLYHADDATADAPLSGKEKKALEKAAAAQNTPVAP